MVATSLYLTDNSEESVFLNKTDENRKNGFTGTLAGLLFGVLVAYYRELPFEKVLLGVFIVLGIHGMIHALKYIKNKDTAV